MPSTSPVSNTRNMQLTSPVSNTRSKQWLGKQTCFTKLIIVT